jgi:hypothetical protein
MNQKVARIIVILIIIGLVGGLGLGTILSVFAPGNSSKDRPKTSVEEMKRQAAENKK